MGGLEQIENKDQEAMNLMIDPCSVAIEKLKLNMERARVEPDMQEEVSSFRPPLFCE